MVNKISFDLNVDRMKVNDEFHRTDMRNAPQDCEIKVQYKLFRNILCKLSALNSLQRLDNEIHLKNAQTIKCFTVASY